MHHDVETSKGELVVVLPELGSSNLLENLEISSPPDFPLLIFPSQLDVWLFSFDPWGHPGNWESAAMGVLWD